MIIVHFEVYVLESRGWMLYARFPRLERDEAMHEARELEASMGLRVKVLRENYNTETNAFDEVQVYISGKSPPPPKSAPPGFAAPSAPPPKARIRAAPRSRAKPKDDSFASAFAVMFRLTLILIVAVALGLLSLRSLQSVVVELYDYGFSITPDDYNHLQLGLFLLVITLVSVPLGLRFLPTHALLPKSAPPPAGFAAPSAPPPKARIRAAPPSRAKPKDDSFASAFAVMFRLPLILVVAVGLGLLSLWGLQSVVVELYDYGFSITPDDYNHLQLGLFLLVIALVAVLLGLRFQPTHALLPKATPPPPPHTDPKLKKSLNKLVARAAADGVPESTILDHWDETPAETKTTEVAPLPLDFAFDAATEPSEPAEPATPQPPPAAPSVPPATELCERFLEGAIRAVKATGMAFDQYQRFALNLYMAGAVGALAELRRLDDATRRRLLAQAFDRLDSSTDMPAHFEERMGEYMLEPRYMRLIQAGRAGIERLGLGDGPGVHSVLTSILRDWNRPATEKKASIMTVMFTDMVGSTDMTQARGDVAAQEIVRRHNAIVRTSLAQFSGKEIKHTGDGIMASFASAANAVEASIQIHREVAAHNAGRPDLALHLRIGLNAGEPIQEEDDLFGVTVQLAARVCAATQSDRTLCTTVVKDLASGKGGAFDSAGSFALKGFRDKIPLWDVVWR